MKFLIFTLLFIQYVSASFTYNPSDIFGPIDTTTGYTKLDPYPITLSNGNVIVTWNSNGQDGSGYGLYGQIISGDGTKIGNEFNITGYTLGSQYFLAGISIPNKFILTWASQYQDGHNDGVFARVFNNDGSISSEEKQINTFTSDNQVYPSITQLNSSRIIIVWRSRGYYLSGYSANGQIFDLNLNKVGNEFQISATYGWNPQVVPTSDGGFGVFYYNFNEMFLAKYDNSYNKVSDTKTSSSFSNTEMFLPHATRLQNGDFVLCYTTKWPENYIKVNVQRFNSNLEKHDWPDTIYSTALRYVADYQCKVTALTNGYVVGWYNNNNNAYVKFFDNNGNSQSNELAVESIGRSTYVPFAIPLDETSLMIIYTATVGGFNQVFGRNYSYSFPTTTTSTTTSSLTSTTTSTISTTTTTNAPAPTSTTSTTTASTTSTTPMSPTSTISPTSLAPTSVNNSLGSNAVSQSFYGCVVVLLIFISLIL